MTEHHKTNTKSRKVKRPYRKIPIFFSSSAFIYRENETAKEAKKRILSGIEIQHKQLSKETLKKLIGNKCYSYMPLLPKAEKIGKTKSADLKALLKLMDYAALSPKSVVVLWRLLVAGSGNMHRIKLSTIAADCGLSVPEVRQALYKQGLLHLVLDGDKVTITAKPNPGTYKADGTLYSESRHNVQIKAATAAKRKAKNAAADTQTATQKADPKERIALATENLSKNDSVDCESTKTDCVLSIHNTQNDENTPTKQEVASAFAQIYLICNSDLKDSHWKKISSPIEAAAAAWQAAKERGQKAPAYYFYKQESEREKAAGNFKKTTYSGYIKAGTERQFLSHLKANL